MTTTRLIQLRARKRIVAAAARGDSIEKIDDEIISPTPVTGEAKAALWLFAWNLQPSRIRRREAERGLAVAVATG